MSLHFLVNGRLPDAVQTGLTTSVSPDGIACLSTELNSLQIQDSGILSGPSSGLSITNNSPTGHSSDPRSDVLAPVAVSDASCEKLNQLSWWPANKHINPPPNKLIVGVPPSSASYSLQPVPPVIRPMLPSADFTIPFSIPSPSREEMVGWSPVNHFFQYAPQSPYTWLDGAVRFPYVATANMTVPPALPFVSQPMYFVPLMNQVPLNQPIVPIPPPPPPPLVQSWISGFPNSMTPPEEHSVTIPACPPRTSLHLGTPGLATPTSFANTSSASRRLATNGEPNYGRRSGVDQLHSRSEVNKGKTNTGSLNSKSTGKKKLGFHNNILYKTELCHDFLVSQACPRGLACQYAHGETELRDPRNHPLYKTTVCQDFRLTGTCVRGAKCLHLHPPETITKRPQRPNSPCLARSTPKSGTAASA
ncbi:hypothetical protein T265_01653 [Opisthorchis viverrini]|uniref:C3H1-type domain-containing protein n=1 Tax=Opisthorchis viverrini TaxID=6198 RepID=A0A075AIU0_OPIVI|nr:hypothetical protein T265_01653 [Opisthorchis viverrini]KER32219.1 hypothetical protein T265_01653 [Opisthorchis viverrini]